MGFVVEAAGTRDGAEESGVETVGGGGLWVVEWGMRRVTVDQLDGEVVRASG